MRVKPHIPSTIFSCIIGASSGNIRFCIYISVTLFAFPVQLGVGLLSALDIWLLSSDRKSWISLLVNSITTPTEQCSRVWPTYPNWISYSPPTPAWPCDAGARLARPGFQVRNLQGFAIRWLGRRSGVRTPTSMIAAYSGISRYFFFGIL